VWFTVQLTRQLGITIHSTPHIYVQGLATPRSEKLVTMNSYEANQTHLSTIASIRSSKSKYISLFEYRAFGRRHGMGAEYGGLVWLSELVQE
jgi:hypothetical protein